MAFADLKQNLNALGNIMVERAVRPLFNYLYDRLAGVALNSAGLVINGAGTKVAKIGASDFYCTVNGQLLKIAASTALSALAGSVANATFNVFVYATDKSGTVSAYMGTAGSSLANVGFPAIPRTLTIIGFIIINPTGTGSFVGGTTNLDDATVVPNAVYVSPIGSFDPTATF